VDPQQTGRQQTGFDASNFRTADSENPLLASSEQSGDRDTSALSQVADAQTRSRRRGAPTIEPERDTILEYISDFSREFGDRASLRSSTTRAVNLFRQSRVPLETFIEAMYRARAIVKERSGTIRAGAVDEYGRPSRHRMAYWFTVLEDLLGLRDERDTTAPGR
jgi:hypothetical protein